MGMGITIGAGQWSGDVDWKKVWRRLCRREGRNRYEFRPRQSLEKRETDDSCMI